VGEPGEDSRFFVSAGLFLWVCKAAEVRKMCVKTIWTAYEDIYGSGVSRGFEPEEVGEGALCGFCGFAYQKSGSSRHHNLGYMNKVHT
jgi:hypothetical protein